MQTPDDRHPDDPDDTHTGVDPVASPPVSERYLELIRSVNREWTDCEEAGDLSVQLSPRALGTIKESIRANARHGAQVEMPPSPAGPYTMSERSLRTLVRHTVDNLDGVRALRTAFEHQDTKGKVRTRGLPTHVRCRVSVRLGMTNLPRVAQEVRTAVSAAFREHMDLSLTAIDVHIEDLHDN